MTIHSQIYIHEIPYQQSIQRIVSNEINHSQQYRPGYTNAIQLYVFTAMTKTTAQTHPHSNSTTSIKCTLTEGGYTEMVST